MITWIVFGSTLSSCLSRAALRGLAASHHPLASSPQSRKSFKMNTYRNPISNPFRMNTYKKTAGGSGTPARPFPLSLFCSFLHSFAVRGNSSSYFSIPSALFAKTPGVYPNYSPLGTFRTSTHPPIAPEDAEERISLIFGSNAILRTENLQLRTPAPGTGDLASLFALK
jgi:hypothetical protein